MQETFWRRFLHAWPIMIVSMLVFLPLATALGIPQSIGAGVGGYVGAIYLTRRQRKQTR